MTLKTKLTAAALATLLAASGAVAKGHDQSGTDESGSNVGAETVGPAQGLGAAKGNGKDKSDQPRGNSANAGKPS